MSWGAALTVDPVLAGIVRPGWFLANNLTVRERAPALDEPLARAASAIRESGGEADVIAAVRTMYKRVGLDPTRTRPSSEALVRRVRRGDQLPRVNSLVDVINWCSLEAQLPFGLYDADRIDGPVTLRLGRSGEAYPGIGKETVHLTGRLVLADEAGAFGNPSSDSARTMVTPATERALVVIFAPAALPESLLALSLSQAEERISRYCSA